MNAYTYMGLVLTESDMDMLREWAEQGGIDAQYVVDHAEPLPTEPVHVDTSRWSKQMEDTSRRSRASVSITDNEPCPECTHPRWVHWHAPAAGPRCSMGSGTLLPCTCTYNWQKSRESRES